MSRALVTLCLLLLASAAGCMQEISRREVRPYSYDPVEISASTYEEDKKKEEGDGTLKAVDRFFKRAAHDTVTLFGLLGK